MLKYKIGDMVTNKTPFQNGKKLYAKIVEIYINSEAPYKLYDYNSMGYVWWTESDLKKIPKKEQEKESKKKEDRERKMYLQLKEKYERK